MYVILTPLNLENTGQNMFRTAIIGDTLASSEMGTMLRNMAHASTLSTSYTLSASESRRCTREAAMIRRLWAGVAPNPMSYTAQARAAYSKPAYRPFFRVPPCYQNTAIYTDKWDGNESQTLAANTIVSFRELTLVDTVLFHGGVMISSSRETKAL